jgi:anaerobic ribonucleoside-triphosphate reductase activating protein
MNVGGFAGFSVVDYPGKSCAVVFCQGCPLRCSYCYNSHLQHFPHESPIDFAEILSFLETRVGLLDSVVFSGGEPLSQPDLLPCLQQVRSLGFDLGLHTSGVFPDIFSNVLHSGLVSWVGFDLKSSFENYHRVTGTTHESSNFRRAFSSLVSSTVPFEIRTTYDPRIMSEQDLEAVAKFLKTHDIKQWVIQRCIIRENNQTTYLALPSRLCLSVLSEHISILFRSGA